MNHAELEAVMRPPASWSDIPSHFDYGALFDRAVSEAPDDATFVELGCLYGASTCYLGTRIKESGKAIRVYAIDRCTGSRTDKAGQAVAFALGGSYAGVLHRNLVVLGLDEIVVPIVTESLSAARLFPDGGLDFVFIDTEHQRAELLGELSVWYPKVKPHGGIIAGHDLDHQWFPGVREAVEGFFGAEQVTSPYPYRSAESPSCWWVKKGSD
jgi:predicted O-methyltransferase YrrM